MSSSQDTLVPPRRFVACDADAIDVGARLIVTLGGKSVGIFNVDGQLFAFHNRCPHKGGALCSGPLTGTTAWTEDSQYRYERTGRILRCGWHGYELEIETGRSLVDSRLRARMYEVRRERGQIIVYI